MPLEFFLFDFLLHGIRIYQVASVPDRSIAHQSRNEATEEANGDLNVGNT